MDDFAQRRGDHELRGAINGLHSVMMASNRVSDLFRYTLESLAKLSHADTVFLVEHLQTSTQPQWRFAEAIDRIDEHYESVQLSSIQQERIAQEIERRFRTSHEHLHKRFSLVTFSELNNPLFSPFSNISRYMILPLHDQQHVFGVAVLLSQQDFSTPLFNRLKPFSLAFSCAYRSLSALRTDAQADAINGSARERYEHLVDASFHSVITTDERFQIVSFNHAAESTFGYQADQVVGLSLAHLISTTRVDEPQQAPDTDDELKHPSLQRLLNSDKGCIVSGHHRDGSLLELRVKAISDEVPDHPQDRYTFIASDVSDHLAALNDYEESLSAYRTLNDLCPIGILELDHQLCTIRFNDYWSTLSGLTELESQGHGWISAIYEEDAYNALEDMRHCLLREDAYQGHFRLQSPLGQIHWVEAKAQPLYTVKNRVKGYLCTLINITEHRAVEHQLRELAELDHLTGLYNRNIFKERLIHTLAMQERHHDPIVLMLLDLDGFKQINDTFGHSAGDHLLKQVALRLKALFRADDVVARLGGDEFTILLARTDADYACFLADKVITELKQPYHVEGQNMIITTSVGVVVALPGEHTSADELMQQADIALYAAKDAGRDEYQFFTTELNNELRQKQGLITALHEALTRNEFSVLFQPQMTTDTNRVIGFEALLRWHTQSMEPVDTEVFIPLLESSSIVDEVSLWVLRQTCELAKHIEQEFGSLTLEDSSLTFSINIAARQLRDPDLPAKVEQILIDTGVASRHIIFELTEHSVIHQVDRIFQTLRSLAEMGIGLSLDDFGTGYSSLSLLQRLPVDHVKIDKSFVQQMFAHKRNQGIIKGMINLAHDLDMTVVAEGVDDEHALETLNRYDCDYYQGFLFSKPVNAEKIIHLLHESGTIEVA